MKPRFGCCLGEMSIRQSTKIGGDTGSREGKGSLLMFKLSNRNIPALCRIPLVRDDRIIILARRNTHRLPPSAAALAPSVFRAIAHPREAIVLIGLRRLPVLARADRRRGIPSRNVLEVRSRQNPPGRFINAILLRVCASAQFAARSFGGALL